MATTTLLLYHVHFTYAPRHLSFILDKTPCFDSKDKAFALLEHYMDEFGCEGEVFTRHGRVNRNDPLFNPRHASLVPLSSDYGF